MHTKIGRFWKKTFFLVTLLVTWRFWDSMLNSSHNLVRHIENTFQNSFFVGSTDLPYVHTREGLPETDYVTVMNLTPFKFMILNKCRSDLLLLVLVHSAPDNYQRRKSIRKTWGSKRDDITVLFMLGDVINEKLLRQTERENRKYGDIIQGSFLDDYRNMTYKHVMSLKYVIYHCPQAKYVLKTDDDVFVNMPTLLGYLVLDLSPYGAKRLLTCAKKTDGVVARSNNSKWKVSFGDYNRRYFPLYCPGWVILYSADVVFALYKKVQESQFFWIDDVLLTGFIREKLNITINDINSLVISKKVMRKILSRKMEHNSIPTFLFGPPNFAPKDMYNMYEITKFKR